MKIIIITGKIGTGKTTTASIVRTLGYNVFESDKITKYLYKKLFIKENIKKIFKNKVKNLFLSNDEIDLKKLGDFVFKRTDELKKLENILHPAIISEKKKFLKFSFINRRKLIFLDIPLFFKSTFSYRHDYVINLFVNKEVQKRRVLSRLNMTEEKYNLILKLQNFKNIVNLKANIVNINTGNGKNFVRRVIIKLINSIK